jgi:type II secretory pathway pseudopilin PulG
MTDPPRLRRLLPELSLVAGLLVLAVAVRRPRMMLTHPLWLDEGWVAGSIHTPLRMLGRVTSSTPVGWTLLLRLVPEAGVPERLRVVPLAFGVATVLPAYLIGRLAGVRLRGREGGSPVLAAAVCGLAAALAPAVVARHDLKQYTAEAFALLCVLLALAWLESGWSPRRLLALAGACVLAALFSQTALLVAAAAFGGLALLALVRRSPRRLGQVAAAGLAVAVADSLLYRIFAAPSNTASMAAWWRRAFIPMDQGVLQAITVVGQRTVAELERTGFGPWPLVLLLVAAGMTLLWRLELRATALLAALVYAELLVAGAARVYPFLDDRSGLRWTARSSTFFSILLEITAALGVVAVLAAAARPGSRLALRRAAVVLLSALVLASSVALLLPAAASAARTGIPPVSRKVPYEDVRGQVRYVLAHRQPGDVVVVSETASFTFADYWPDRPTTVVAEPRDPVRYRFTYPGRPDLVIADWSDPALAAAATGARRVWIVRMHLYPGEQAHWRHATRGLGRVASPVPGLLLVHPVRPGPPGSGQA